MILNEEQRQAIEANDRFCFCLAGAGSGKTTVLIKRIEKHIKEGVSPERILAITFTRQSALEIRTRMTEKQVEIHTFHSLCLNLIKNLKKIDLKVIDEQNFSFRKNEILKFSLYKNSRFRTIRPFNYARYQKALKDHQMMDFDDILIYFLNISKKNLNFFDHILIDEFQDTNRLQYDVLKHLIHQKTAVFAVGDPDQAIYRFRGSCKAIIKRFIDEFNATPYTLKMNYRSHQRIIGLANTLILRQKSQYSKTLMPYHKDLGHVAYSTYQNEEMEAKAVIKRLKSHLSKGIKPHHVAVIYRNHFRAQTFKYFLNSNDLRYAILAF